MGIRGENFREMVGTNEAHVRMWLILSEMGFGMGGMTYMYMRDEYSAG